MIDIERIIEREQWRIEIASYGGRVFVDVSCYQRFSGDDCCDHRIRVELTPEEVRELREGLDKGARR